MRGHHTHLVGILAILFFPLSASGIDRGSANAVAALRGKADRKGQVRVIVRLDAEPIAMGFASSPETDRGRAGIRKAQYGLLARIPGRHRSGVKHFANVPLLALSVTATGLDDLLAAPEVVSVVEDVAVPPTLYQSTPLIGGGEAFDRGFTGTGWAVAVLDTGVDRDHPFLSGAVVSEACFSTSSQRSISLCPDGSDEQIGPGAAAPCVGLCEHGTHVAGIAAGNGGAAGPRGVAPTADVIAIQVFSHFDDPWDCDPYYGDPSAAPCVLTFTSDQILGLEHVYGLRNQFQIAAVNMSLGGGYFTGTCDDDPRKTKIDLLRSVGIATAIATGNEYYTDAIGAPACISSAVAVGSTSKSDVVSSFSNSSPVLDLLAPGGGIYSSIPNGGYDTFSGTSMATPHVAGAFAVLKSTRPGASVDEILTALETTGRDVTDWRNGLVRPRIQLDEAIDALTGSGTSGQSNDHFAARRRLSGRWVAASGSNENASKEPSEPHHAGNPGGSSVWWSWVPPSSGTVRINTHGSDFDTTLGVYVGADLAGLVAVASNDDAGGTYQSEVHFFAEAGTEVQIAVDGYAGSSGEILIAILSDAGGTEGDDFAAAVSLSGSTVASYASNQSATKEPGEPYHAGNAGGQSLWWLWTAAVSGPVTVHTFGSDFDTLLGVYTGSQLGALHEVASNDDSDGSRQSSVSFKARAGERYRIAVDGYGADEGNARIQVVPEPGALALYGAASATLALLALCRGRAPWLAAAERTWPRRARGRAHDISS